MSFATKKPANGAYQTTMLDCTINLLNPLSNVLAENIRAYRKLRGKMTQATLAARAGMSLRGIQDIEYGDSWPSAETIEAIANCALLIL